MKTCPCHAYNSHKIHGLNNFLYLNQELSKEWHPILNAENTPTNIFPSSKEKHWWICEKGHEFESTPFQRHYMKQGCPYCRGLKVCIENSLSTLKPNIASQWNFERNQNLTPEMITISSGKRVWWKCGYCQHEWEANVNNRVRTSGKCPKCAKK
jgi:Zn finger protein HypA/HybF involved in hydrogenase expression